MKDIELCPCKSGKTYGECCGPVHAGARKAETAEELMRARYSAYAVEEIGFLKTSGGSDVQAEFDEKSSLEWARSAKWNGLEILATEKGGVGDDEGVVEFVAHYAAQGKDVAHHERAFFQKIDGEWKFIDGEIQTGEPYRREQPKINRNALCPCGSGKKYKKCCGRNA
ncbi:MAG: YchJ family protein [Kiritimatiellae bacterium]|nr:YchJ family protein [Kiritimatiellia bacterium]